MDSISELGKCVKEQNLEEFNSQILSFSGDVIELIDSLNDKEKEDVINWCREIEIFMLHKIFASVINVDSIRFIKDNLAFYKKKHLRDDKERTWLHIAVRYNRSTEILTYLVKDMEIDVDKYDINKFTALHAACMKQEYVEGELDILIKRSDQLVARSFEDISPLELASGDMRKLNDIKKNSIVKISDLLCQIDRVFEGLPDTEDYYFNDQISTETIWTNMLQKNDKYRLIYCMKKDLKFHEKYYLSSHEFAEIILNCHENGQGIITYIKTKYAGDMTKLIPETIFIDLSGKVIKTNPNDDILEDEYVFHKSALFLALITGRFELVPNLLTYNQFDIIPYGLMICLICHNLSSVKEFPDQVLKNINKLKDFCEKYSVAVLNRTVIRDLSPEKNTIYKFLIKSDAFCGQRILDIAYLGKSSEFLGLPSCQDALTSIWYEKGRKCPALKFYLHSAMHFLFLGLLSYILVSNFYSKISTMEILCYIYGFGYMIEEARQIYISYQDYGVETSYLKDPSNALDIGSILFMFTSIILRLSLPIGHFSIQGKSGLYKESNNFNLFFIRLVLCISLILFYMRIIYFGSIFEQLGPKLKMIGKMIIRDLMPLVFIFLVFIASFGVAFQSLLFPNSFYTIKGNNTFEKKSVKAVIGNIFRRSAITIFDTHYPFEELEHDEGGYIVNSEGRTAVYFLLIIYMVVVNIMLTNLLIALFSYTVTVIIQRSRESWKAKRYKDIKEYYDRSLLPPPLNLFEILFEIICAINKNIKSSKLQRKEVDAQEIPMLDANDNKKLHKDHFISFKILQAFALKDCRYKLMRSEEDEEYERKMDIKSIKNGIKTIEKALKDKTQKSSK